jgi:16S rRNA (guanine1207-N2)-methyltransferase
VTHESRQPQYFAAEPSSPSRPRTVRLDLTDVSVALHTDSGVFSADRIDPGTKILLDATAPSDSNRKGSHDAQLPPGDLVDLGAGYGPIALTLALRYEQRTIWAVEPNERARDLCRANAVEAGVGDRIRVVAPQEVPPDLVVASLFSNPPIRIGKQALHALLTYWMGTLARGGEAWLVVQRHLGADSLGRWLTEVGLPLERVASRRGYRVLRVRPSRSQGDLSNPG